MSPEPRYILALDQGTTSSRAILFDRAGTPVATSQREFPQHYPQPGWVEHDPIDLFSSQSGTAGEVLARANLQARDIAAIGITNQRETTLVWERATGKPICPAIVWQDRRTSGECARLKQEGLEPLIQQKTGLRLDPYFSGTKLRWILDHIPGTRRRAENGELLFGTVDSWLIWRLTEGRVHATDVTNASRTLLFNIHTGAWDRELLDLFAIPESMLPEVKGSSEFMGEATTLGGIPITGVAGDQQAALFGQACFSPGMAKNTYGTGCFLLMHTGEKAVASQNNLVTTIAWKIGSRTEYALEGSVFIAGAVIQWLRDELEIIRTAAECDELASSVPDNGGVYLVPAFAGLGAPHWDPYARGAMFGLTRGSNRRHLCRAALESIAFQSAELVVSMQRDSGITLRELRVDGGAVRSQPLLQFQADLLGVDVIRPRNVETTALGAAYLAGLAVGFWSDRHEIAQAWEMDRTFSPGRSPEEVAGLTAGWHRAVERAKGWDQET